MNDLVSAELWSNLENNKLKGVTTLIAYLDATDHDRSPEVVPCRWTKVIRSECPAGFAIIEMEIGEFAHTPNLKTWSETLNELGLSLPHWNKKADKNSSGRLAGEFCHAITQQLPSVEQSAQLSVWQSIVDTLSSRGDFKSESCFMATQNPYLVANQKVVSPKKLSYRLRAGRKYRLPIIFYHPSYKDANPGSEKYGWIVSESDGAIAITHNENIEIDSPYDKYEVDFRAKDIAINGDGALSLYRKKRSDNGEYESTKIVELTAKVRSRWMRDIALTLLIGVLLMFQTLFGSYSDELTSLSSETILLIAFMFGILIAASAVFGIRRPI